MNNDLKIFMYHNNEVRTIEIDGDVWFVGKDVADILGYVNSRDALAKHVDDEDKRGSQIATPSNGGYSNMIIINESGVYSLIFSSKLPTAKEFKHWVTSEVLPAIRRTGSYSIQKAQPVEPEIVAPKKSGYLTRATVKAIESIIDRAFKCQETEDFETVIALDNVFRANYGYSVLEQAGLEVVSEYEYVDKYFYSGSREYQIYQTNFFKGYIKTYKWKKSLLPNDF